MDRQGVRAAWSAIPALIRTEIDRIAGARVVEATNLSGGFSPGPAARCDLADGRRVFVKAAGLELNPHTPGIHRREAEVLVELADDRVPAPTLIGVVDDGDWVALVIEWIDGRMPVAPLPNIDVERMLDLTERLASTPPPETLRPAEVELAGVTGHWPKIAGDESLTEQVEPWVRDRLDQFIELDGRALDAMAGEALVHFDLRTDNVLFNADGPTADVVVDWANAAVGAPWIDLAASLPALHLDGAPPPVELFERHVLGAVADREAVDAFVTAVAGYFLRHSLLPAPPGLPTLRPFQAAQASITLDWLRERLDGSPTMR